MKFTIILSALAAIAAAAGEKPKLLNSAYNLVEGEPFTFKYSGCESGCTLEVQTGPSTNLKTVKTITCKCLRFSGLIARLFSIDPMYADHLANS